MSKLVEIQKAIEQLTSDESCGNGWKQTSLRSNINGFQRLRNAYGVDGSLNS
jgi:hypothetical protein